MKKSRLASAYTLDFEAIGIVSQVKEYKLAWHLNQTETFHLVKHADIRLEFSDTKVLRVSAMADENEYYSVYLLRNKLLAGTHTEKYLVSELKQFDYLLKLSSQIKENWADELLLPLKSLPVIDYALSVDLNKLRNAENLLF